MKKPPARAKGKKSSEHVFFFSFKICLLACLFACLLACLLACLFVCLLACLGCAGPPLGQGGRALVAGGWATLPDGGRASFPSWPGAADQRLQGTGLVAPEHVEY